MVEMIYLDPSEIETDWGTQHRPGLVQKAVQEYAEAMKAGDWEWERNPAKVAYDGEHYGLIGGYHRLEAAKLAGIRRFCCAVQRMTRREAVTASLAEKI